jgi:CheY-like chemotaxis protein
MIESDRFFIYENEYSIPEEHFSVIINYFAQKNITAKSDNYGTGLTHYNSSWCLELFEGETWFQTNNNETSHYYFSNPYYPISDFANSKSPSNFNIENLPKSLRILVAEDDDINYMFIEYLFNNSKHKLVRAINGQEAVDIITTDMDFDIILMDLKMPIMSGFEATKIIKGINPDIPIIALTAYVFEDDKQKAMNSGCDDFIVKPYRMEDLFDKIYRLTSRN